MFEVILSNGDRAEAETLDAALYAAATLVTEASAHTCTPSRLLRNSILVTRDGRYDGIATGAARNGLVTAGTNWRMQ